MIDVLDYVLLGFMAVTALAAIRLLDLFAVVMMFGIYSLLAASVFVVLDAVDVVLVQTNRAILTLAKHRVNHSLRNVHLGD